MLVENYKDVHGIICNYQIHLVGHGSECLTSAQKVKDKTVVPGKPELHSEILSQINKHLKYPSSGKDQENHSRAINGVRHCQNPPAQPSCCYGTTENVYNKNNT